MAISLRQVTPKGRETTLTSVEVSFPTTPTPGNTIVVWAYDRVSNPEIPLPNLVDNQGNTYRSARSSFNGLTDRFVAVIYAAVEISASGTFTLTLSDTSGANMALVLFAAEFSGLLRGSNSIATFNAMRDIRINEEGLADGIDPDCGPSGMMAYDDELVVTSLAMGPTNSPVTIQSYPSGYINLIEENDTANYMLANGLYKITNQRSTLQTNWVTDATDDQNADWASVIVSFVAQPTDLTSVLINQNIIQSPGKVVGY